MNEKPITIIGGGLAGLALGIGLRQRGVPSTIFEAGRYPRHRVCGEFISGRGLEILRELNCFESLQKAGAIFAETAAFFSRNRTTGMLRLPQPALCLSRFEMDALLAETFRQLGGNLHDGQRWTAKNSDEGVVRASGRRIAKTQGGWRFFGLKIHAKNVSLEADLEMHLRENGYIGLCKLAGGTVNICGLFRSRTAVPDLAQHWRKWFLDEQDSILNQRLRSAEFVESSFCAVAGISLQPQRAANSDECRIGDALTMIPPVTGNGMSMAFESAHAALDPLVQFASGEDNWQNVREKIARRCDTLFQRRLAWGAALQNIWMRPRFHRMFFAGMRLWPTLWNSAFEKTR